MGFYGQGVMVVEIKCCTQATIFYKKCWFGATIFNFVNLITIATN